MLHEWLDELGRLWKQGMIELGSEGVRVVPFCTATCVLVHSIIPRQHIYITASLERRLMPRSDRKSIIVRHAVHHSPDLDRETEMPCRKRRDVDE